MNLARVIQTEERYALRVQGAYFFKANPEIDEWEGRMDLTDEVFENSFKSAEELCLAYEDKEDAVKIVKTLAGYKVFKLNGQPINTDWFF